MWYGDGWGHMSSWGWVGMLFMLVFALGTIALIGWSIRGTRPGQTFVTSDGPRSDDALLILRQRYARGEVTKEEFDQARTTLLETQT